MKRFSKSSLFPDVNVWVALTYQGHVHHSAARGWFVSLHADARLFFCRVTQLGLLRLLTTEALVSEIKEKEKAPVGMPGGGMGGMY